MSKQVSSQAKPRQVRVEKYRRTRYWAVWIDGSLLAVTVYRKGALAIQQVLLGNADVGASVPLATAHHTTAESSSELITLNH
jgi:hypothetical protein